MLLGGVIILGIFLAKPVFFPIIRAVFKLCCKREVLKISEESVKDKPYHHYLMKKHLKW